MANKNPKNYHFDIPVPVIVLAYFLHPPIGIVLTVLRILSGKKTDQADKRQAKGEIRETYSKEYQKQNGKKTSPAVGALIGVGVFNLVLAFLMVIGSELFSYSFGAEMLREFFTWVFPFLAISGGCLFGSKLLKKRDTRYNRIRTMIGNRESMNLTKLAAASDESLKQIRKDVQKLIDKGEFGDSAYIDLGTNNFMRTPYATPDEPEAFDYRTVYGNLFHNGKNSAEKEDAEPGTQPEKKEETDGTETDFDRIIREIRRLNDEIKDLEVSDRIDRIEAHTQNIFDYVTDHPEALPQIRTFMNYYLPTTLKLLESYSRIERVGVAGENMKKSKDNIENILDLLVVGFEQQIDQLFRNESIDISSDISVLETMMQKDGLSGKNDFDFHTFSDDLSVDGGTAGQAAPKDQNA